MKEEWVDISWLPEGLNERYQVSNFGNVKNKLTGKLFKNSIQKDGYRSVKFRNRLEGLNLNIRTHRLVARAFLVPINEEFDETKQVNHIDGNKSNNNVTNLELVTCRENSIHAKMTGLNKNYGITHGNSKLTMDQVEQIKIENGSCKSIGKLFGVSASTVSLIKNGKRYNSEYEELR